MPDQLDMQVHMAVRRIRQETYFAKYRIGILTGRPTKEGFDAYLAQCEREEEVTGECRLIDNQELGTGSDN